MAKSALQSIAATLAAHYGLKPSEATAFVNLFFEEIQKGLEQEKQVKVRGLGTFKLQAVKPRESVNVNTGERVLIGGHEKMAFTPDNALKELVNRPFADFETVVVKDGVDIESVPTPSEPLDVDDDADVVSSASATDEQDGAAEKEMLTSFLETPPLESAQSGQDVEEVPEQATEQPLEHQDGVAQETLEGNSSDTYNEESKASEEVGKGEDAQEEADKQEEKTPVVEESVSSATKEEKAEPVVPAPHAAGVVAQAMTASEKFSRLMDEEPIEPSRGAKEETQREQDTDAEKEEDTDTSSVETVQAQSDEEVQETPESTEREKVVEQKTFSWADEQEDAAGSMGLEDSSSHGHRKRLWVIAGVVAVVLVLVGAAFYLGGFIQCGQSVQETSAVKPQMVSKKQDTPKKKTVQQAKKAAVPVADTLQVTSKPVAEKPQTVQDGVDLEQANDYPAIRYGAYHITGIDKKVVLRKGETMAKYCRRTLGKDMIGYFEAVNGTEPLAEGDTLLVPRVELRPEYRK